MEDKNLERKISDIEFLTACELVTVISNYTLLRGCLWINDKKSGHMIPREPESLQALNKMGWSLVTVSSWLNIGNYNEYMGILLTHEVNKVAILIHRGMQLTVPNIANCLRIGAKGIPLIVDDALSMCDWVLEFLKGREVNLFHTGFSMGGFLAQITSSYCNHNLKRHNTAYCYDAPGAFPAIALMGYNNNSKNTYIYLTSPNLVNTATTHFGYVRQIEEYHENPGYSSEILKNAVDSPLTIKFENLVELNTMNCIVHTLNTHNQTTLKKILVEKNNNNFRYFNVKKWPLADNSFKEFERTTKKYGKSLLVFAFDLIRNGFDSVLEKGSQQVTNFASMNEINGLTHHIANPTIKYFVDEEIKTLDEVSKIENCKEIIINIMGLVTLMLVNQNMNSLRINKESGPRQESPSRFQGAMFPLTKPEDELLEEGSSFHHDNFDNH